jgi:hypothetical protein
MYSNCPVCKKDTYFHFKGEKTWVKWGQADRLEWNGDMVCSNCYTSIPHRLFFEKLEEFAPVDPVECIVHFNGSIEYQTEWRPQDEHDFVKWVMLTSGIKGDTDYIVKRSHVAHFEKYGYKPKLYLLGKYALITSKVDGRWHLNKDQYIAIVLEDPASFIYRSHSSEHWRSAGGFGFIFREPADILKQCKFIYYLKTEDKIFCDNIPFTPRSKGYDGIIAEKTSWASSDLRFVPPPLSSKNWYETRVTDEEIQVDTPEVINTQLDIEGVGKIIICQRAECNEKAEKLGYINGALWFFSDPQKRWILHPIEEPCAFCGGKGEKN